MTASEERYPEHVRMVAVKDEARAIGDFITGYLVDGRAICERHEHSEGCYDETGHTYCGLRNGSWVPVPYGDRETEKMIADWLEIDLEKIAAEKDLMLADIRSGR